MTPQQIEAMKQALEALKWCHGGEPCGTSEAITALEEALAQPEQIQPSAYSNTHQPERTWVGLTDDEQRDIAYSEINVWDWGELMDAVEAKLKEKNT